MCTGDYAGKRGTPLCSFIARFYIIIISRRVGEGDEKYSGKYHSHRLGKYNNVNPSRPTGLVGGYNWRNVNEPGIHGSLRIFSSPPLVLCRLCREAAVIIKAPPPSFSLYFSPQSPTYTFFPAADAAVKLAPNTVLYYIS